MKKVSAFLLALTVIISVLLSGCGQTASQVSSSEPSESSSETEDSSSEAEGTSFETEIETSADSSFSEDIQAVKDALTSPSEQVELAEYISENYDGLTADGIGGMGMNAEPALWIPEDSGDVESLRRSITCLIPYLRTPTSRTEMQNRAAELTVELNREGLDPTEDVLGRFLHDNTGLPEDIGLWSMADVEETCRYLYGEDFTFDARLFRDRYTATELPEPGFVIRTGYEYGGLTGYVYRLEQKDGMIYAYAAVTELTSGSDLPTGEAFFDLSEEELWSTVSGWDRVTYCFTLAEDGHLVLADCIDEEFL